MREIHIYVTSADIVFANIARMSGKRTKEGERVQIELKSCRWTK